jgi:DNA transformation protein
MAVSQAYKDQVGDLLGFVPGLRIQRMFGGAGLWSDDLFFALIIGDELYLKTDEQTRGAFEAEGCGPWVYERNGVMRDMGYHRAPDLIWDDPDEARDWTQQALAAAMRKRSKPKAPRKAKVDKR